MVCTTQNTGTTGHNGSEPVTTTTIRTTTNSDNNLKCEGDKCDWQDAGESQKEVHVILKIVLLIKFLTIAV